MAPIIWGNHLATGHEELDAQHRTLIDTFNRLAVVALGEGHSREELEAVLIFLRDFAVLHFELEQELMARSGYPSETEHRRLHAELALQIDGILDAFHGGTTALTAVTLEYLDAWLQRHIQEEDFRLAEFLVHAQAQPRG